MSSLSDDAIKALLADEANRAAAGVNRGIRGPKVDPTSDRTLQTWYKLNPHSCGTDCEHRKQDTRSSTIPEEQACWNPECKDTRPTTDIGRKIVVAVKGQYVCRYCFLAGYLLDNKIPGMG